jgi:LacI family transcriptional regulator
MLEVCLPATMRDIARQLGLSVVTVSRALRNYPDISPATKKRILELAMKVRYRTDLVARSLVTGRTHVWGLIIPDLTHSFFVEISKGVDSIAAPDNHIIIVDSEGDGRKEASEILTLLGRKIDGLIAAPVQEKYPSSNFDVLDDENIPYVLVDRLLQKHTANSVVCDNVQIGRSVTEHLIRLGHRKIAHINCPGFEVSRLRQKGYQQALSDHHLRFQPQWVVAGGIDEWGGYQAAQGILKQPSRPTAIFAVNDRAAIGAMKAILKEGLRIPEDMALVGSSNIPNAEVLRVSLTSVDQHPFLTGRKAAEILKYAIENRGQKLAPQQIVLEPTLIIRESCGSALKQNPSCPIDK